MECGRSRETAKRSDLAGWAEYGYCASHSRYFCGLRLHLVTTLAGLPVAFALADAEADERAVPLAIFTADPDLTTTRPGQAPAGGKNYYGAAFETALADTGIKLLRPARHGEPARSRTPVQTTAPHHRISQRHLRASSTSNATAATHQRRDHPRLAAHPGPDAAIWHNDTTSPPQRLPRERAIPRANAGHPQTTSADAARSHCLRSSSAQ